MSRRRGYPDQSCTFATKADAEIRAKSIESEMGCGAFVDRSESESLPLGKLLDCYRMIAYTNQARHASRTLLPARHACGPPGTWTFAHLVQPRYRWQHDEAYRCTHGPRYVQRCPVGAPGNLRPLRYLAVAAVGFAETRNGPGGTRPPECVVP